MMVDEQKPPATPYGHHKCPCGAVNPLTRCICGRTSRFNYYLSYLFGQCGWCRYWQDHIDHNPR